MYRYWSRLGAALALPLTLVLAPLLLPAVADGAVESIRSDGLRVRGAAPDPGEPDLVEVRVMDLIRHEGGPSHAAGHVVVRFADALPGADLAAVAASLGAPRLRAARHGGFHRVEVPPGQSAAEVAARFAAHPSVTWAEVDPVVRPHALRVVAAQQTNDPLSHLQWNLDRIGFDEARRRNPGAGDGVVVAVLDSGVAYGNGAAWPTRRGPDLEAARFAPGRDVWDGDDEPYDEGDALNEDLGFDSPRLGHGTLVASVIAATVDNNAHIAGIAPRVTILPVRVLGPFGGTFSAVAEGVHFAVDAGADVINMSLGGSGDSQAMSEAVRRAFAAGVVLVASAGNEAEDPDFGEELGNDVGFPARYPQVIAVGATGFDDRRADYSNPGPGVELMAPAGENAGAEVGDGLPDGVLATGFVVDPVTGESFYGTFAANGTSFSAPQVAAGAALLVGLGIERDPEAVRAMLRLTIRDLGAPGRDDQTGHGMIDLAAAHRGLGLGN